MSDADGAIEAARAEQKATMHRHQRERMALLVSEYGAEHTRANQLGMRTINPNRNAHDARTRATLIRVEAEELRGLPVADAAQGIEAKRAEKDHARWQAAERARQVRDPFEHEPHRPDPQRDGPARGL